MTPAELDSSALKSSVAFTGRLACMTRAEAFEVVRQHGGTPSQTVTKRTKLLIVGELGWPLLDDGRPSNKLARARSYSVPVVSERRFLEWTGKFIPDNANKAYSADQLASLSGLSGDRIQELAQLSLRTNEPVVLASVTWQVPVRSRSCSPMASGSRKSFAASTRSENGCPTLG